EMTQVPWRSEKPEPRRGPWPGALPRPVPATVFRPRPPVRLEDAAGAPVVVTARGLLRAPPARLLVPAPGPAALPRAWLRAGPACPAARRAARRPRLPRARPRRPHRPGRARVGP